MQYQKVKSVAKIVQTKGPSLEKTIADTMRTISDIVGGTLGPGGQPVLIERQEFNLPAMVTKDGVTVFRALGFNDPAAHVIMEAARDASVRTANEAGDGTTTATILAEAIVRKTKQFCRENPKVSPQRVCRRLEGIFKTLIEPSIENKALKCDFSKRLGRKRLKAVATISANGDGPLADAVMECFDLVGDEGNVTILEVSGPSSYEVEQIDGYSIPIGYEDSCARYYPKFINDPATQRCFFENPAFIVYHGRVTDIQTCVMLMETIGAAWQSPESFNHNVVLVATGFSESVLGQLALNFAEQGTINVFPLLAPQSPINNGQLEFLEDICAVTGAKLLDPLNNQMELATLDDVGVGCRQFECHRFRSTIIGRSEELLLLERVDLLRKRLENPESQLEKRLIEERIGKLTGGIAKLKVIGASNGELREKRDRAEDAVCAVRGAIKHGCLPGGCWTLLSLCDELEALGDPIVDGVLIPALEEPFWVLLKNAGLPKEEASSVYDHLHCNLSKPMVYDALEGQYVEPLEAGILDSVPAVLEAIRSSLSIATLLGTLSGTIVFARDGALERQEASDTANFLRSANEASEADQRP